MRGDPGGGMLSNRSGQALYIAAGSMLVLLGLAALGIDIGLVVLARTEAQRAADAAALAGAGVLLGSPTDPAEARTTAIDWASRNRIRGTDAVMLPEDVDVPPDSMKVRVRVLRTSGRGNAVETLFARVLGFPEVDVSAVSAAQSFPAGGVNGILPFALPDLWLENGASPPDSTDTFGPGDVYVPMVPHSPVTPPTGYARANRGTRIELRSSEFGASAWSPGSWHGFVPGDSDPSASTISGIVASPRVDEVVRIGDVLGTTAGTLGPGVLSALLDIIALDPLAYWSEPCGCVARSGVRVDSSPRIRPIPLIDPRTPPGTGGGGLSDLRVTNVAGVFLEQVQDLGTSTIVFIRLMDHLGVDPLEELPVDGEQLVRVLRIVE